MRWIAGIAWIAWIAGCGAGTHSASVEPSRASPASERPAWVPDPTAAQLALLRPGEAPVASPARPIYPDLERFAYAPDRRIPDPRQAVRVTRLVGEILERSERLYDLVEASADDANLVEQYGPAGPDEPDPFVIAQREGTGSIALVPAPLPASARGRYDEAIARLARGDAVGALALLEPLCAEAPHVPAPRLARVRALRAAGRTDRAESLAVELVALDPTLATAHLEVAELAAARGDRPGALASLAHALALHPPSAAGHALAARVGSDAAPRITPFRVFLGVDPRGAVRVGTAPTPAARAYGACRAMLRFEPEVRAELLDVPPTTPYFLSAVEETLCLEGGIGAYAGLVLEARARGMPPPEDEPSRALLVLAHEQGLLGYAMVEVLGRARPERARAAPEFVHRAMVRYVRARVLGLPSESNEEARVVLARSAL